MEFTVFAFDKVMQLARQQQFDTKVIVFEKFVVEQGPDQLLHTFRLAVHQFRFIHSIHNHDHAREPEGTQQQLQLLQESIAIIATLRLREWLFI